MNEVVVVVVAVVVVVVVAVVVAVVLLVVLLLVFFFSLHKPRRNYQRIDSIFFYEAHVVLLSGWLYVHSVVF